MKHLLCLSDYPRELVEGWVVGLDCRVTVAPRRAGLADLDLTTADVVIGDASRHFRLDAAALERLDRCSAVVQPSVGVDGVIDVEAAHRLGIRVANAPGYNAAAVADWTVMAMLVVLRHGLGAANALRSDGWCTAPLGRELGELTVGLVGYGAVARAVHDRLRGFGSDVLVSARGTARDGGATQVELDELLGRSDVVSLHVPHTPETHHLLGAQRLARMREGSVLVNSARGALVDEDALVAALQAGRPAAAALDVFAEEPLPATSPLLELPQVYLTPHVAASTEQARMRVRALVGANVRRALLGEQLEHEMR